MYFPYLRGRQFELIALREYAVQKGENNNIIPIIEPVKSSFNSMKRAFPILTENDVKFALILNPCVGDFPKDKGMTVDKSTNIITEALKEELVDSTKWIPTYILTNNYTEIFEQIEKYSFNDVMIICCDSTDVANSSFAELVESSRVKYIVSEENRSLKSNYKDTKEVIRLDDKYKPEKRNKDYLAKQEEKFTEEHKYYSKEGYKGFSDYTILSNEFKEGGSLPYAVVIHITYAKADGEVWIRHFTSETNDDQSGIQAKFSEAIAKAIVFTDTLPPTHSIEELKAYYTAKKYPGLGMVKKISVKNHLELMNSII